MAATFRRPAAGSAVDMLQLAVAEGVHRVEDAYTNWYACQTGAW